MVTMWLTDYVANTAIFVYKRENYLTYNITSDMVSYRKSYYGSINQSICHFPSRKMIIYITFQF